MLGTVNLANYPGLVSPWNIEENNIETKFKIKQGNAKVFLVNKIPTQSVYQQELSLGLGLFQLNNLTTHLDGCLPNFNNTQRK